MTNMQADMILGQLNTIYAFLMKNSELVPCTLSAGLAKNITTDAQINSTENGQKFLAEFNPLSMENSGVEFHKMRMTFSEVCDVIENCQGILEGDIMILQLICKDESENEDQKEGE